MIYLNIFISDINKVHTGDFASGSNTYIGACRAGNSFNGLIFAQVWANMSNGSVEAVHGFLNGRTNYDNIFPDDRSVAEKIKKRLGIASTQATREIQRAQYGFSTLGSVNFPRAEAFSWWGKYVPAK